MPEIGVEGQQKLKAARVLVVGAGGLGCPALMYLAAAGVGGIGVIDFDKVEESNIQGKILFTPNHVGLSKANAAVENISNHDGSKIAWLAFSERKQKV